MKKIISLILLISMTLSLFACSAKQAYDNNAPADRGDGNLKNSSSSANGIYYSFTGDYADAEMAMPMEPEESMLIFESVAGAEFNTEEYSSIVENQYMSVKNSPLSTFSVDVDTASYANVRRMILNEGRVYDKGAVRIEEMINYFDYNYPEPDGQVPFSVNYELSDNPWKEGARLLKIGLQTKNPDLSELPNSNLVFLIDTSGSMYSNEKLPLVQEAFRLMADSIREGDVISIVTYAGNSDVPLEGAGADDIDKILDALDALQAGGSTHGSEGINTAYEIAERYFIEGGNNRIILATDGDLNVGVTSESALKELVEEKRESGIFLSVLGFGYGNLKDNKMETLADNGNGNYSYIDGLNEAKKVLVEELAGTVFTVAKDVKIQIEFNPEKIKGYRLVGYENRMLQAEDFENDEKDAGDIGAGHSVTALYEIIMADSEIQIPEIDLKYQQTQPSSEFTDELMTVSLRYKEPDGDESKLLTVPITEDAYSPQMSDGMSFAAGVAQFGMLLRDSSYAGSSTYDEIYDRLSSIEGVHDDEYKNEFLYLVQRAK